MTVPPIAPLPPPVTEFQGPYRFLSNFYGCLVPWEGAVYMTSEHAYQAAKTLDPAVRRHIQQLPSAGDAKAAGRTLQLRPGWDRIRRAVMLQVVLVKFVNNDDLRARLLATGYAALIEGNRWGDTDWGAVPEGHPKWASTGTSLWHAPDGITWSGRNWLGQALMMVRQTLQEA